MKKLLGFIIIISFCTINNVYAQTETITGKAKEYYEKAQQGDVEAQFNLARC